MFVLLILIKKSISDRFKCSCSRYRILKNLKTNEEWKITFRNFLYFYLTVYHLMTRSFTITIGLFVYSQIKFHIYINEQHNIKTRGHEWHPVTGKGTNISLCPLLSSRYVGIFLQLHSGQGMLNIYIQVLRRPGMHQG